MRIQMCFWGPHSISCSRVLNGWTDNTICRACSYHVNEIKTEISSHYSNIQEHVDVDVLGIICKDFEL